MSRTPFPAAALGLGLALASGCASDDASRAGGAQGVGSTDDEDEADRISGRGFSVRVPEAFRHTPARELGRPQSPTSAQLHRHGVVLSGPDDPDGTPVQLVIHPPLPDFPGKTAAACHDFAVAISGGDGEQLLEQHFEDGGTFTRCWVTVLKPESRLVTVGHNEHGLTWNLQIRSAPVNAGIADTAIRAAAKSFRATRIDGAEEYGIWMPLLEGFRLPQPAELEKVRGRRGNILMGTGDDGAPIAVMVVPIEVGEDLHLERDESCRELMDGIAEGFNDGRVLRREREDGPGGPWCTAEIEEGRGLAMKALIRGFGPGHYLVVTCLFAQGVGKTASCSEMTGRLRYTPPAPEEPPPVDERKAPSAVDL